MTLDEVKYVLENKPEGFGKFLWHHKQGNVYELKDLEKTRAFYTITKSHINEDGIEELDVKIEEIILDENSTTLIDFNLLEELKKDKDHVYYVYFKLNNIYAVKMSKSDCSGWYITQSRGMQ